MTPERPFGRDDEGHRGDPFTVHIEPYARVGIVIEHGLRSSISRFGATYGHGEAHNYS
jgi:hypothetical protein